MEGMKMKLTVTEIAIHPEDEDPVLGERATYVKLADEGAGTFIKIIQHTDLETNAIRLDFDEVDDIFKAIKMLKDGVK
jgi:hypothetical protein